MLSGNETRFVRVVHSHLSRYPLMECCDLYKLLHQASMGNRHSSGSIDILREYLMSEIEELPEGPPEPVLDVISDSGDMARINLRPFLVSGGDPEILLEAFLRSSREYRGSRTRLERYREWITGMAEENLLTPALRDIARYMDTMRSSGYHAVHHSAIYRKSYSPSYRVILTNFAGNLSILKDTPPEPDLR